MLQAAELDTFVMATTRITEAFRDIASMLFKAVGITIAWAGETEVELGI